MRILNLNDNVYFKLTDKGNEVLDSYINEITSHIEWEADKNTFIKTDDDGMEYTQLWVFMNIFGKYFYNGSEPVTEKNRLYLK